MFDCKTGKTVEFKAEIFYEKEFEMVEILLAKLNSHVTHMSLQ